MSDAKTSEPTGAAPRLLAAYDQAVAQHPGQAWTALLGALADAPFADWLDCAQRCVLRGRSGLATDLLAHALARFPDVNVLAFALAGLHASAGRSGDAESLLRQILTRDGAHAAAALMLARVLCRDARSCAAAQVLRACFGARSHAADTLIDALELLDEHGRKADAAAIAQDAIAAGCDDARIHAYAATFLIQLGQFEQAREHYLFAWRHDERAAEWDVPFGLASAQRYADADDTDFALFESALARNDLSPRARSTLLFGMGKAFDDIGDAARAAAHFAQANELAHTLWPWSRKQWRRSIEARLQAPALASRGAVDASFVPVFVLGVPRSGTTLAAQMLSRHAGVCNRGELSAMWTLSQRLAAQAAPSPALLDSLAREYEKHVRQDDAGAARWFIDKQPLNLLHVGLILALFPQAKIVHCQRGARDTALSLWMQFFREPSYAFAYDMADIGALLQGCGRMMAHLQARHPDAIRSVQYEQLAAEPAGCIAALAQWIGLLPADAAGADAKAAINTASVWQARQPVYTRSIGRWRAYAAALPQLLQFDEI